MAGIRTFRRGRTPAPAGPARFIFFGSKTKIRKGPYTLLPAGPARIIFFVKKQKKTVWLKHETPCWCCLIEKKETSELEFQK